MTSIYEIATLTSVLTFSAWTLVVCAIAKFLFGSYPAAEILYRLAQRDKARQEHAANLSAATPVGEHAATVQGALLQPRIATAGQRLLSYFLTCFACQSFWAAMAVYALTRGASDWRGWVFSAAAYSAAATILARFSHGRSMAPQRSGCASCGGR
ncbi:MAG: hypothetical protein KJ057_09890 [Phycisphaerae bacterium]|nr:hypothetical protein [Planctomycetia bacterium]MCL4718769.1 hypothetical protein [Phycisphaerae bacterium]